MRYVGMTAECPCMTTECACMTAECPCMTAECPCMTAECPCMTAECPCMTAECPCTPAANRWLISARDGDYTLVYYYYLCPSDIAKVRDSRDVTKEFR